MTLIGSLPYRPAGGDVRSAAGMMSDFDAIQAVVDGNLDALNMKAAFAKDNVEPAFSGYKVFATMGTLFQNQAGGRQLLGAVTGGAGFPFRFDPTWFAAGARVLKLRHVSLLTVGSTAPAVNFTISMRPTDAATFSNSNPDASGANVTGSNVTQNTPAANVVTGPVDSTDYTAPAAGNYNLVALPSGAMALNAVVQIFTVLMYRQV